MLVVGIDPGHSGGAVALLDGRVVSAMSWRRYGRKKPARYLWVSDYDGRAFRGTPDGAKIMGHLVEDWLATLHITAGYHDGIDRIAVEGLFVPRKPTRGFCTLAETTGRILGVAEQYCDVVMRPRAAEWRPVVLGLRANAASDLSEETAARVLPALVPGWSELPEAIRTVHVCEAACIARYAQVTTIKGNT